MTTDIENLNSEKIERRKGYIHGVDLEIDSIKELISTVTGTFPDNCNPIYRITVQCEDLSEYESNSKDFFVDSGDLIQRKNIDSIFIEISTEELKYHFIIKHGAEKSKSHFSIESKIQDTIDSHYKKVEDFIEYLKKDEGLKVASSYLSFAIYIWLIVNLLVFAYWSLKLDSWPQSPFSSFWSYLKGNLFFFMSFGFAISGISFFDSLKKHYLFPYVSIVTGRRGKKQKIHKKYVLQASLFLFITIIPALYSYMSKPTVPKEQAHSIIEEEYSMADIIFDVSPTNIQVNAGTILSLNYTLNNKSKELLRNVKITNTSNSGLKLDYNDKYIKIGFIKPKETIQGKYKIKIPSNYPSGKYRLTVLIEGNTLNSSFDSKYAGLSDYKHLRHLVKNILIEVIKSKVKN